MYRTGASGTASRRFSPYLEDVALEFRSFHASPQDVGTLPKKRFQLGEARLLTDLKAEFWRHAIATGGSAGGGCGGWEGAGGCLVATAARDTYYQADGTTTATTLTDHSLAERLLLQGIGSIRPLSPLPLSPLPLSLVGCAGAFD